MTEPLNNIDHLYFAPHLDDVALSCGGRIALQAAAGQSIVIATVTAGSPPPDLMSENIRLHHDRWAQSARQKETPPDMVAVRRAEDELATRILGATAVHWAFYDCLYRQDPDGGDFLYTETAALFGPVAAADEGLVDELARRMAALPPARFVYLPLGIGRHVDHTLTRQAGEQAYGPGVWYYEEYPYVAEAGALEAVLIPTDRANWQPVVTPLSEAAVEQKIAAILAYQSQLSSFFASTDDLERQVRAEARRVLHDAAPELAANGRVAGAERYWRRLSREGGAS